MASSSAASGGERSPPGTSRIVAANRCASLGVAAGGEVSFTTGLDADEAEGFVFFIMRSPSGAVREIVIQRRHARRQLFRQRAVDVGTPCGQTGAGSGSAGTCSDGRHQFDLRPLAARLLQDHPVSRLMHAEGFPFDLARQVERLLGHTVPRQFQGIGRHPLLERRQHLRRSLEEAVGRHQAVDPRMHALEVVVVDEQPDPPPRIFQVEEHGALHALPPQRSPEPLDLPQRLRPLAAWPRSA